jgi:hypothetical protein
LLKHTEIINTRDSEDAENVWGKNEDGIENISNRLLQQNRN